MNFEITIIETLEKVVTIEAASCEEAQAMVEAAYNNAEYVLSADDFTGVRFCALADLVPVPANLTVYVIERDNPQTRPEPEVLTDGKKALEMVRAEFEAQMRELGTSLDNSDIGADCYGCYWEFAEEQYIGTALIDSDYDGDRWEWRITSHEFCTVQ